MLVSCFIFFFKPVLPKAQTSKLNMSSSFPAMPFQVTTLLRLSDFWGQGYDYLSHFITLDILLSHCSQTATLECALWSGTVRNEPDDKSPLRTYTLFCKLPGCCAWRFFWCKSHKKYYISLRLKYTNWVQGYSYHNREANYLTSQCIQCRTVGNLGMLIWIANTLSLKVSLDYFK